MNDYKFLSRKFMLSILLVIISTWFLAINIISGGQWQIILTATVLTYLGSKTLEKVKSVNIYESITLWQRITGMLSREFVLALSTLITVTIFAYTKRVNGDIWFQIVTSIGSMYNIFNAISKTE